MPDLKEYFTQLEKDNLTSNIAGYVENNIFKYEMSTSEHLPAAAMLFDAFDQNPVVYTNLKPSHWLYTYMTSRGKRGGLVHASGKAVTGVSATGMERAGKRALRMVAGHAGPGPLGTTGGLFQAAKGLDAKVFYKSGQKVHTSEKGLHRALRYYMLAAYAALGKCANENYDGGNFICALAVDDTGKILSWGLNSGSFHHGEVNMLMNYFGAHAGEPSLPSKTIVFSTLTPCAQCSNFLQSVRPADSIVFMGQPDTGPLGKAGEAHGKYLRDLTDPVATRVVTKEEATVVVGTRQVRDPNLPWGPPKQEQITQTRLVDKVNHIPLDMALASMVEPGNIAKQIGQKCQVQLVQSFDTLTRKVVKDRTALKDQLDQKVKISVLTYLSQWLASTAFTAENKIIT